MEKNILYYGIELNKESQEILKKKFGKKEGWKVYCHHMTVVFNSSPDIELSQTEKIWFERNKDKEIILIVTHYGIDEDKVAAVRVMCSAPSRNKVKHITLGTKEGKPVDSNFIKEWTLTEPIILVGKPKVWLKKLNSGN